MFYSVVKLGLVKREQDFESTRHRVKVWTQRVPVFLNSLDLLFSFFFVNLPSLPFHGRQNFSPVSLTITFFQLETVDLIDWKILMNGIL